MMTITKKNKYGFTLMEAIVTILILGVLAAIAIPNYNNVVRQTRIKDATTTLLLIYTAQKIYFNEHGAYLPAANIATLNQDLNLGIIPETTLYSCNNLDPTTCTATGDHFTLTINVSAPTPIVLGP